MPRTKKLHKACARCASFFLWRQKGGLSYVGRGVQVPTPRCGKVYFRVFTRQHGRFCACENSNYKRRPIGGEVVRYYCRYSRCLRRERGMCFIAVLLCYMPGKSVSLTLVNALGTHSRDVLCFFSWRSCEILLIRRILRFLNNRFLFVYLYIHSSRYTSISFLCNILATPGSCCVTHGFRRSTALRRSRGDSRSRSVC